MSPLPSRAPHRRPLLALALLACAGGCGEEPGAAVTYHQRPSVALKEKGTALTEEEAERRAAEEKAKRERLVSGREVERTLARLRRAEDAFERAEALAELGKHGELARPAAEHLVAALQDEEAMVRAQALRALGRVLGEEARPHLEAGAADDDAGVRVAALEAWRSAGIRLLDAPMRALEDADPRVQLAAVEAMASAEPPDALVAELREKAEDLRGPAALRALVFLAGRDPARFRVPELLIALLDHQEPQVRVDAARYAREQDARSAAAARTMARILGDDPEERVRREVWTTLKSWTEGQNPPAYDPAAEPAALRESAKAWANWLESRGGLLDK